MKRILSALLVATVAIPATAAEQSPIDIRRENAVIANMPALQFSYGNNVSLTVLNNGSPDPEKTVRSTPSGTNSLSLGGTTYNLQQFHFHTQSEHLLNGVSSPMESHFVHQSIGGEYTVVGRFIELGAENLLLKPIFDNLPPVPNATFNLANFDLSALVPTDLRSYRYLGSLTTPGFNEGVNWIMMEERLFLSQNQIDAFRSLFPLPVGNFREVQALNGRVVQTDVTSFVPEPTTWMMLVVGFGAVGVTVRRRRNTVTA